MPIPRRISSTLGISAAHYAVSPDGTRVAFEGAAAGYVSSRLYVANVDGSDVHLATDEPVIANTPAWSPAGDQIVYVGAPELVEVPGPASIVILDVGSGRSTRIFRTAGEIWFPTFSPDGQTILFTRQRGLSIALWSVPITGGPATVVRRDAAFGVHSPDGRQIAFRDPGVPECFIECLWTPAPGVFVAEVATDGTARDTAVHLDGPNEPKPDKGRPAVDEGWAWSRPVWSPDGQRIAYMDGRERWGRVRVIDVARRIGTTVGKGTLPAWLDTDILIVHRSAA